MKNKLLLLLMFFCATAASGQLNLYNYKRALRITQENIWYKVTLPDEIFSKLRNDLADLRLYGIAGGDTIEAPYILEVDSAHLISRKINFKIINTSFNKDGYYYTFEIREKDIVNQVDLTFNDENFDWQVDFEGSNDQKNWFTLLENYRILSIRNSLTEFDFTIVKLPDTRFHFIRMRIRTNKDPQLITASVFKNVYERSTMKLLPVKSFQSSEVKKNKQTIIDIALQHFVPVSTIKVHVADTIDFYRPISIQFLADSFQVKERWHYNYQLLSTGTLNSTDSTVFRFQSTLMQHLRFIINNQDNAPLTVDSISVFGYEHHLLGRFDKPATYYLAYGNENAERPIYDITNYRNMIPQVTGYLQPLKEQVIEKTDNSMQPLFKNKLWLWLVISVMVFLLGWFSLKMMRKA
jgi:hypothetical protein